MPPAEPLPFPGGPPAPRRRRRGWVVAAVAVAAVAVLLAGVVIGYAAFPPHGLRLPVSISGAARLSGTHWDDVAGGMIGAVGTQGQTSVAGVYGAGGRPAFAFLATNGASPVTTDGASVGLLSQYLEDRLNMTLNVDVTGATTVLRGGVTYQCFSMGVSSITGFACAWNDSTTTGYVVSFVPPGVAAAPLVGRAVDLAAAVRAAAVR